jgi:hypothetical protein
VEVRGLDKVVKALLENCMSTIYVTLRNHEILRVSADPLFMTLNTVRASITPPELALNSPASTTAPVPTPAPKDASYFTSLGEVEMAEDVNVTLDN